MTKTRMKKEQFKQECNAWLMEMSAKYHAPLYSENFCYERSVLIERMRNEFMAGKDCFKDAEPTFKRLCEMFDGDYEEWEISDDEFYGRC